MIKISYILWGLRQRKEVLGKGLFGILIKNNKL